MFAFFGKKVIGKRTALKMLMKLTVGQHFCLKILNKDAEDLWSF